MNIRFNSSRLTILLASVICFCNCIYADAAIVKLHVDSGTAQHVDGFPISFGLPFPFSAISSPDSLQLIDDAGSGVPAQFSVLSKWTDNSLKSALVTFFPQKSGKTYKDYRLVYGNDVNSVKAKLDDVIKLVENYNQIVVDTGFAKFVINKEHFTLFEQVYTAAGPVLEGPGDLVVKDNKTGGLFRSSLLGRKDGYKVTIVENGPLRLVAKIEGKLRGESGHKTSDGDSDLLSYKIWLSFYVNTGLVNIKYTFIDSKARSGDPKGFPKPVLSIKDNRFILPLAAKDLSYTAGGEADAKYQGKVTGNTFLLQDAVRTKPESLKGYAYAFAYEGVGSGERAQGWMDVSWNNGGITAAIKYFWQNYPGEIAIDENGKFSICLQPEQSDNIFSSDYPGVAKTHDILLNFHDGGYSDDIKKKAEIFLANPVITAPSEWYAQTEVFGPIAPTSNKTEAWERKVDRQYECSALVKGCSKYPQLFGKEDFGDYQLGYNTNKQGGWSVNKGFGHYEDAHGWILEFLRQGQKKYFDYAAPFAIYNYDIGVMHVENPFYYPNFPAGMIHWHGDDAKVEAGHIVPGGIAEYYLLTGDQRALDVIKEQADWIAYNAINGGLRMAPERPGEKVGLEEYERPHAWPLYTLIKAYEATGEKKYWNAATVVMQNIIDWWKMPQAIILFQYGKKLDPKITAKDQALYYETTDWTKGNGYWISTLRTDNCSSTNLPLHNYEYQNHVPIAWMAAFLESAIIRYYENLKKMGGTYSETISYRGKPRSFNIDSTTIREMIIQTINVIVEHNYVSTKYPSVFPWLSKLGYDHFVYSACPERDPKVADGDVQMPFVLLYASNFQKSEVSDRWKPQWEFMQYKWHDIANSLYVKTVKKRPEPLTGYNGAQLLWNMPFAVNLLFKD